MFNFQFDGIESLGKRLMESLPTRQPSPGAEAIGSTTQCVFLICVCQWALCPNILCWRFQGAWWREISRCLVNNSSLKFWPLAAQTDISYQGAPASFWRVQRNFGKTSQSHVGVGWEAWGRGEGKEQLEILTLLMAAFENTEALEYCLTGGSKNVLTSKHAKYLSCTGTCEWASGRTLSQTEFLI